MSRFGLRYHFARSSTAWCSRQRALPTIANCGHRCSIHGRNGISDGSQSDPLSRATSAGLCPDVGNDSRHADSVMVDEIRLRAHARPLDSDDTA